MGTSDNFLDRLHIAKGSRIVDVGFGSNKELLTLSSIVGETGLVFWDRTLGDPREEG